MIAAFPGWLAVARFYAPIALGFAVALAVCFAVGSAVIARNPELAAWLDGEPVDEQLDALGEAA